MRRAILQRPATLPPRPSYIVPAVTPPEDRSRGGPGAFDPTAPTARATAGPSPTSWEFPEYEHGGGI
jgi:hypothetical protein